MTDEQDQDRNWGGARAGAGRPPMSLKDKAERRIKRSKQLRAVRDVVLKEPAERLDFWQWILTAQVKEILEWVETSERIKT